VIAVVLRPVLVRPQCKPLLESGWAPSNPSDSKESRSLRTDTKIKAQLADLGGTALTLSPTEFAKLIADDTEKWGKVIRAANIKPD
jgi:hypothetical protein